MSWISVALMALALSMQSAADTSAEPIPIAGEPLTAQELRDGGPFTAVIVDLIRDGEGTVVAYSGGFGIWLEQPFPDPPPTSFRPFRLSAETLGLRDQRDMLDFGPDAAAGQEARPLDVLNTEELYTIVWDELRSRFVALDHRIIGFAVSDPSQWYCGVNACRHAPVVEPEIETCDQPPFNESGQHRNLVTLPSIVDLEYQLSVQFRGCEAVMLLADGNLIATALIDQITEVEGGFRLIMRHQNDPWECSLRQIGTETPRFRADCSHRVGLDYRHTSGMLFETQELVAPHTDVSTP